MASERSDSQAHGLVDQPVGITEEIFGREDLGRGVERLIVQQHGTKDGALYLYVVR